MPPKPGWSRGLKEQGAEGRPGPIELRTQNELSGVTPRNGINCTLQHVPKGDRHGVFRQGGSNPRVGLYARVSTHDQQTLPLQLSDMREHAERRRWTVTIVVEDVGSGVRDRPKREDLMRAARRRELDLILMWRLDRWGRSLVDLITTIRPRPNSDTGGSTPKRSNPLCPSSTFGDIMDLMSPKVG